MSRPNIEHLLTWPRNLSTLPGGGISTLAGGGMCTLQGGGMSTLQGVGMSTLQYGGMSTLQYGGLSTLQYGDFKPRIGISGNGGFCAIRYFDQRSEVARLQHLLTRQTLRR